jgi:hypothetical protein
MIAAPIVFVLSGLFLANPLVNPAGSLPYTAGQMLCFLVAPILLISGIAAYAIDRYRRPDVGPGFPPRVRRWRRVAQLATLSGLLMILAFVFLPLPGGQRSMVLSLGLLVLFPSAVAWRKIRPYPAASEISWAEYCVRTVLGSSLIEVVLLGCISAPYFITIPPAIVLIAIATLVGLHLLVSKRHRPVLSGFLVVLGVFLYYSVTIPELKGIVLTTDWMNEGVGMSYADGALWLSMNAMGILILGSALVLLYTSLVPNIRIPLVQSKKRLGGLGLLLLLFGTLS